MKEGIGRHAKSGCEGLGQYYDGVGANERLWDAFRVELYVKWHCSRLTRNDLVLLRSLTVTIVLTAEAVRSLSLFQAPSYDFYRYVPG